MCCVYISSSYWVISEKIHTPMTEGMLENLTGGGVNGSGNPDGRGALNLKLHSRGPGGGGLGGKTLISISSMF